MNATTDSPLSIIHYDRDSYKFSMGNTQEVCAACRDLTGRQRILPAYCPC